MNAATNYLTYPLAAGAYTSRKSLLAALTHSYDATANKVLCGKVKPESILDDACMATTDAPTCPHCVARLARMAK